MKKRTLILLALCLLLLTACTEKKDQIKEQTITKVNEKISDITNISENQIKKSYTYIKDNYTKFKDKKIYEELIYHIKYIQAVGKYTNNDLTTLANKTLIYIEKDSKKNQIEVKKYLSKIEGQEEKLIKQIYNNYIQLKVVKTIISKQTPIATGDANDKNMTTPENINKAIDYLNKYVQNPFKNDEVLEKTIYYSLYLKVLGPKDNDITKLGEHIIKYISNFDKEEKDKALQLLTQITKNQSNKVNEYYNGIKRNE
jgi:hypothetical protein